MLRPPPRAVPRPPSSQLGAQIKSPAVETNDFHSGNTTHPSPRTEEVIYAHATALGNDATNGAANHGLPESNGRDSSDTYVNGSGSGNDRGSWEGLVLHPDRGAPDAAGFSQRGERGTAPMHNGKGTIDYGSVDLQALREMTLEIG